MEIELQSRDWRYLGEGAANIVIGYDGDHPSLRGKVLRLRKAVPRNATLVEAERSLWSLWPNVVSAANEEQLLHAYMRDVMRPHLGSEYVDPGKVVLVREHFLRSVSEDIRDARPLWRSSGADVDFTIKNALLFPDHTKLLQVESSGSPTIAVEIKPKCGYLPNSYAIASTNQVKTQVSRFEMHQYLKYAQGEVKSLSSFCPLDLFSGNRQRIQKALADLFKNPQNNLRVFVDGVKVFPVSPDSSKDTETLEASLEAFTSVRGEKAVAALQSITAEVLCSSDVLTRVLRVQQQDYFDIEGVIHVYYSFMNQECTECASSDRSGDDHATAAISCLHSIPRECQQQVLCNFLTATTAKDCSLMLTLQAAKTSSSSSSNSNSSSSSNNIVHCPETNAGYHYKAALLDLDLKSLSKVPYYHALDQKIVKLYKQAAVTKLE